MSHDITPRAQIGMIKGSGNERILFGDPDDLLRALAVSRKAGTMVPCNRVAPTDQPGIWFVRVRLLSPPSRRRRWLVCAGATAAIVTVLVALAVAVAQAIGAASAVLSDIKPAMLGVGAVLGTIGLVWLFRGSGCHIEVKHWHD